MKNSALPHSAIVASHTEEFLNAVSSEVAKYVSQIKKSNTYRAIFKASCASHAVLESLRKNDLPLLKSASGIARRIPMLIACRQLSLAHVELRRFIEVVSWYPYFREHPVEWDEFRQHPEAGIVRDTADPIRFAAHRELAWHHAYMAARYRNIEWIAGEVEKFASGYARLSTHVHAAIPSMLGSVSLPFDEIEESDLQAFRELQRSVLSAGCLMTVAAMPESLSKLPAVERAWFDWLIGAPLAMKIRASSVGAAKRRTRQQKPRRAKPS